MQHILGADSCITALVIELPCIPFRVGGVCSMCSSQTTFSLCCRDSTSVLHLPIWRQLTLLEASFYLPWGSGCLFHPTRTALPERAQGTAWYCQRPPLPQSVTAHTELSKLSLPKVALQEPPLWSLPVYPQWGAARFGPRRPPTTTPQAGKCYSPCWAVILRLSLKMKSAQRMLVLIHRHPQPSNVLLTHTLGIAAGTRRVPKLPAWSIWGEPTPATFPTSYWHSSTTC